MSDDEAKRRGLVMVICATCEREFFGAKPDPLFNCTYCAAPPPETYYSRWVAYGYELPRIPEM